MILLGWYKYLLVLPLILWCSVTNSEEYAVITVSPKEQHDLSLTVTFNVEPFYEDRLILTSLSMEVAKRQIGDSYLTESSVYGWFVREHQDQLWIGKVVGAGQTTDQITVTIPALQNDIGQKIFDSAKYRLFISMDSNDGLPAFLSNSPGVISYLPIKSAIMTIQGEIHENRLDQWMGWERAGAATFRWSAAGNDPGYLYAIFEWRPPFDNIIAIAIALFPPFVVGLLVSVLIRSFSTRAVTAMRYTVLLLLVGAGYIAYNSGLVSILLAISGISAGFGFFVGPRLPKNAHDLLEKFSG